MQRPANGPLYAFRLINAAVLVALVAAPPLAQAQPARTPAIRQSAPMSIEVDRAELIQTSEPMKTVFVANPEIADVQVPTPTSVLVYGKKPGTTTVFAITDAGVTTSYTVRVSRPAGDIAAALRAVVPTARISVAGTPNGVTISGSVDSPRHAQQLQAAAKQYLGDKEIINFDVSVAAATQVTLRVRVAEVSRNVDKALGVHWDALFNSSAVVVGVLTGRAPVSSFGNFVRLDSASNFGSIGGSYRSGSANISALIDALDQQGLATVLAEPSLTAISGETASFLAGGEYPIPVPQGNQVTTIDYKRFGVSVDFTPTVLDANRISIKVRPEVSELTSVGALTLNGAVVPALTVRRAETTVELGSGESFAIAGLFQNNAQSQIRGLPWLADIPVLGALFRSTTFLRNESELVIIVTPFIVRPVSAQSELHVPTDGVEFASDIERILLGRLTAAPPRQSGSAASGPRSGDAVAGAPRLRGSAGFMLE